MKLNLFFCLNLLSVSLLTNAVFANPSLRCTSGPNEVVNLEINNDLTAVATFESVELPETDGASVILSAKDTQNAENKAIKGSYIGDNQNAKLASVVYYPNKNKVAVLRILDISQINNPEIKSDKHYDCF